MPFRLGDITASQLDDENLDLLAAVTRLTIRTVRSRLGDARGNMLVRNVFDRDWPYDSDGLGQLTIAVARAAWLAPEIAEAGDLTERTVGKRLRTESGNRLVENAFPEINEDDDDLEDEDDDDDEFEEDDDDDGDAEEDVESDDATTHLHSSEVDLLGAAHVVSARSASMRSWLAERLAWTPQKVRAFLRRTHGRKLLRNALADRWPIDVTAGARTMLGGMNASAVGRSASLIEWVARILKQTTSDVQGCIHQADGNTLMRNLFAWPEQDDSPRAMPRAAQPREGGHRSPEKRDRGDSAARSGGLGTDCLFAGRWRVLQAIGDPGGFSTVYEVKDESRPDRGAFVMKVASGNTKAEQRRNEERLREEVKIAHRLRQHQNICAYLDDGLDLDRGLYYAIMMHAGDSLERLIRERDFSVEEALDIVQKVATGLDYAHQWHVIHQDLKPANILIQDHDHGIDVRIGDWGVSRHGRGTQRADGSHTVVATVVGYSLGYAAPEQLGGEVRKASDQYSLALLFCSMLERRIFGGRYKFEGLKLLGAGKNAVLSRALSHDPEDRYGSCGQFSAKLREA